VKVAIAAKNLENGTTLTWEPPAGAPANIHYELLWRETAAAEWQFVREVPAPTHGGAVTITVPVSKDNVFFGVRAVDAGGHRGLVVVP
jgi:hypothetical protein